MYVGAGFVDVDIKVSARCGVWAGSVAVGGGRRRTERVRRRSDADTFTRDHTVAGRRAMRSTERRGEDVCLVHTGW